MLTFIKLGGSLITDKRVEGSFRADVMTRIAEEIAAAHSSQPDRQFIIGHGSGSFGHVAARKYDTLVGVHTAAQWHGFAEVATTASALNTLVLESLRAQGLPVMRFQPSASAIAEDGRIVEMALEALQRAYQSGLIPLVYGDVALDRVRGGTIISTETVFTHLATHLPVRDILLLGEVAGVLNPSGEVIPEITPVTLPTVRAFLGESAGTDVTGGMLTKVSDMVALVAQHPSLRVRILDGSRPGALSAALRGDTVGTLICAD